MSPGDVTRRVEAALTRLELHEHTLASQWRECCDRWGPMSAAALGCLLWLVREGWGRESWGNCVDIEEWHDPNRTHRVLVRCHRGEGSTDFERKSLAEALVAAVESAP